MRFCVVGHGAECGYLMLVTVQNINLCCGHGPQCGSVLLSIMHNVVLCCCLWSTVWFCVADHGANYFFLRFWPLYRIWCCVKSHSTIHSYGAEYRNLFRSMDHRSDSDSAMAGQ
jgi:hypothetical protein